MTFLFRFIIVLAVAVGLGVGLYYTVQMLPDDVPSFNPGDARVRLEGDNSQIGESSLRPEENRPEGFEGGERDRDRGIRLYALAGVIRRFGMFSVITFIVVMVAKLLKRKPARAKTQTS